MIVLDFLSSLSLTQYLIGGGILGGLSVSGWALTSIISNGKKIVVLEQTSESKASKEEMSMLKAQGKYQGALLQDIKNEVVHSRERIDCLFNKIINGDN